uniref:Uncharacterized protein n=1 Tax=Cacopsylla melanoneura TaxID=428564 RepID=A0A8D8S0B5_9HEMI
MSRKMNLSENSYFSVESKLSLLPLSDRRTVIDLITFHNILNSNVCLPQLLCDVNIHAPSHRTRNPLPFCPPNVRTNYLMNSPLNRFQRLANDFSELDLFNTSINQIKSFFLHRHFST